MIELLVVMAIIAIIATLGVSAFRSGEKTKAVSVSAATVGSAVSVARQLAITKNCRTRFVIVTDAGSKTEWKLHRYGIMRVKEDTTDVGGPGSVKDDAFELDSRMEDLPTGVYFRDNEHNNDDNTSGAGTDSIFSSTGSTKSGSTTVQYAYIEFLPSGGTSQSTAANIFEITRAPSAEKDFPNNKDYIRIGVAQSTGRVKFERPDLQ